MLPPPPHPPLHQNHSEQIQWCEDSCYVVDLYLWLEGTFGPTFTDGDDARRLADHYATLITEGLAATGGTVAPRRFTPRLRARAAQDGVGDGRAEKQRARLLGRLLDATGGSGQIDSSMNRKQVKKLKRLIGRIRATDGGRNGNDDGDGHHHHDYDEIAAFAERRRGGGGGGGGKKSKKQRSTQFARRHR